MDVFDVGKINKKAIDMAFRSARPGAKLSDINRLVGFFIQGIEGCEPAFLGYNGFPGSCCLSVNDQAVHGIGGDYELQEGDVLTVDCGVQNGSIIVDAADTRVIGTPTVDQQRLMHNGKEILEACMAQVRSGATYYDILRAGYNLALNKGVYVLPDFGGHTIEPNKLHGTFIPHAPDHRKTAVERKRDFALWNNTRLKTGQIICLEPVVTEQPTEIILEEDGWTVRTSNGSLAVHYEHCMMVTDEGYEVIC